MLQRMVTVGASSGGGGALSIVGTFTQTITANTWVSTGWNVSDVKAIDVNTGNTSSWFMGYVDANGEIQKVYTSETQYLFFQVNNGIIEIKTTLASYYGNTIKATALG